VRTHGQNLSRILVSQAPYRHCIHTSFHKITFFQYIYLDQRTIDHFSPTEFQHSSFVLNMMRGLFKLNIALAALVIAPALSTAQEVAAPPEFNMYVPHKAYMSTLIMKRFFLLRVVQASVWTDQDALQVLLFIKSVVGLSPWLIRLWLTVYLHSWWKRSKHRSWSILGPGWSRQFYQCWTEKLPVDFGRQVLYQGDIMAQVFETDTKFSAVFLQTMRSPCLLSNS